MKLIQPQENSLRVISTFQQNVTKLSCFADETNHLCATSRQLRQMVCQCS